MSHSKSVEYCKFYNKTQTKTDVSPASGGAPRVDVFTLTSPFFCRPVGKPGDLSYKPAEEHVSTPDTTHHVVYDRLVGISSAQQQRLHVFQELPGRTFSSDTMTRFTMSSGFVARRVPKK